MSDADHNEKLWARVEYWRTIFEDCENYPSLSALQEQWELVEPVNNARDWSGGSGNPIAEIMGMIEAGQYPPPEYLLALHDCFEDYLSGAGDLETILFGKPKPKAGNYARQAQRRFADRYVMFKFSLKLRKGMTRIDAAEQIVNEEGLSIDAESLLRKLRGFGGFHKSQEAEK